MTILSSPTSNDDWKVHSLNIQGIFFQRLIASLIRMHKDVIYVTSEYPVEYPRGEASTKTQESRLDILAQIRHRLHPQSVLHLLIECKKANPEFVDWLFFPKMITSYEDSNINYLTLGAPNAAAPVPSIKYDVIERHDDRYVLTDDARETRGSYENTSKNIKTKTSNASITEAAYQVVLAAHAYAAEINLRISKPDPSISRLSHHLFLPVIVTTANLYLCKFQPSDTSLQTGEIPFQKVTFEPVSQLFYEYSIPPHLQIRPDDWWLADKTKDIDKYIRRHILVINSNNFEDSLNWLQSYANFIIGG
jgi:hypothetical protein